MNDATSVWPAPAKINLFLHVVGRRSDGYHLLQTLFQFLTFGDELRIEPNGSDHINVTNPELNVPLENDLVYRAAMAVRARLPEAPGVDIHVTKRIPMGGGLGGGSSNAATALVALNELWHAGLSMAQLKSIGATLGADVPIFVEGHASWAEGVGDQFTQMNPTEPYYLLVHPGVHVDTGAVFSHPDLPRDTALLTPNHWGWQNTRNDCENLVAKLFPKVAECLAWMGRFGTPRMTGTGACVFMPFGDPEQARDVLKKLPKNCWGIVTKGLNRSPLIANIRASQS